MADLEEMGYLHQPHASAGRIPTDKAYRFYVDYLLKRRDFTPRPRHDRSGIYGLMIAPNI